MVTHLLYQSHRNFLNRTVLCGFSFCLYKAITSSGPKCSRVGEGHGMSRGGVMQPLSH